MSDDLVTRLEGAFWEAKHNPTAHLKNIIKEAADEIERLRAEVARLGSFLHPLGTVIQGKAVRGD